jgi:hypothetical protein
VRSETELSLGPHQRPSVSRGHLSRHPPTRQARSRERSLRRWRARPKESSSNSSRFSFRTYPYAPPIGTRRCHPSVAAPSCVNGASASELPIEFVIYITERGETPQSALTISATRRRDREPSADSSEPDCKVRWSGTSHTSEPTRTRRLQRVEGSINREVRRTGARRRMRASVSTCQAHESHPRGTR